MYRIAEVAIEDGPSLKCYGAAGLAIHEGDLCIFRALHVLECGRVVGIEEVAEEDGKVDMPELIRCATLQDKAKATENALMSKMAKERCQAEAEKHGLDIKIIRVRYSFDRAALTVLFVSEDRIDFREMVRELAGELNTRVEMKQIGVRDQAAILGGLGPCGRKLCCCSWLQRFESINVKMAKAQLLSLNPVAISGMCGRLKCCLRYEYEQYREMGRGLPRDGSRVETPDGPGMVVGRDVMAQRVKVRMESGGIADVATADARVVSEREKRREGGR